MEYKKGTFGWLREQANKDGFDNICRWNQWRIETGKLNQTKIQKEHSNKLAINRGFKDDIERRTIQRWDSGKVIRMQDYEECESHIGCVIGEDKIARPIFDSMFEEVIKKKNNNPGYEYVCKNPRQEFLDIYSQFKLERNKEYKIDVKTAHFLDEYWKYRIDYNNKADFFLLIGLNTIGNISEHTWLIYKNEIIRNVQFWMRFTIKIAKYHLYEFDRYEIL